MKEVLVSWIGDTDLNAPKRREEIGIGPIAQALQDRQFDEVLLLNDYPEERVKPYLEWLKREAQPAPDVLQFKLSDPTDLGEIYVVASNACKKALGGKPSETSLTFHISPGTPAMAVIWILLAMTKFPAKLIKSSRNFGVKPVPVPFDIYADFLPDILREQDKRIRQLSDAKPPESPGFEDIIYRSETMDRLIQKARRIAPRDVPVIIEGESGTGKELLARAIRRSSLRRDAAFFAVNCGALPEQLLESELFGHEKGAFSGANKIHKGYFEVADKGTLFLDEIGEMKPSSQVKLLRALQEGEIVRVGSTNTIKVDVRIIAATNRTLTDEVREGRFREDLYYRLAAATLKIPPLRERMTDLVPLIDTLLGQISGKLSGNPEIKPKKLSAGARKVLTSHRWPGNVRELWNTLQRIVIWSDNETITAQDVIDALLPSIEAPNANILGHPLGGGFSLRDLIKELAKHYINRALDETNNNKTKASKLLGLTSRQTLDSWIKKYG